MIWDSIPLMTGFDVMILMITLVTLWIMLRHRRLLVQAHLLFGLFAVISGLILISGFYLADLVTMWGMPLLTTRKTAMAAMRSLHLHYNWINMLAVSLCTCGGFVCITHRLLSIIRRLQESEAKLHRETAIRQHVNREFQESEERFRDLIEGSIQGILVHRDHKALFVNQAYADIFGYASPDEILALDTLLGLIAPHERERLMGYHEACVAGKTVSSHYAYQGLHRDGSLLWLDMTVRLVTWDGQPATQSIIVDITERKRAEGHLQFQAQLLDSVQESVVATDLEGHVTYWGKGAEALYGYRAEEVMGTSITFIVGSQEEQEEEQQRMRTVAETGAWRGQYVQQRKDGSQFWADTVIALVTDSHGQPCGFVGIDRDLTVQKQTEAERQHLEAQLHHAHKMEALGTLAGGIAHEFNNVLGAILGFTDLTQYEVPHGSPAWSNLQEVLTAGRRAKDLVQQILTFSRQSEQERESLSVSLVVREVLTLLRATLPTTIEIRPHLRDERGTILANRTQLHQVVLNLCTNAGQAMRETGGVLEIGVDHVEVDAAGAAPHPDLQPGPYVRVWIRDTGPGMPPEVMERIFEPFYTTKGVGEGTGMGLAIVHGLVTSHDGTISVKSTPGDGSVFTIYLPQIAAAAAEEVSSEATIPHGTGRLLFVDDEAVLARVGHAMLARLGYDVVVHTSGVAALEAFQAAPHDFDLVITDQTMPQMTGEALARELRGMRPDIPIILCTGFSHTMNAEKAHAMGIDAFCLKPLEADDLAVTVQQVLDKCAKQET